MIRNRIGWFDLIKLFECSLWVIRQIMIAFDESHSHGQIIWWDGIICVIRQITIIRSHSMLDTWSTHRINRVIHKINLIAWFEFRWFTWSNHLAFTSLVLLIALDYSTWSNYLCSLIRQIIISFDDSHSHGQINWWHHLCHTTNHY